MGKLRDLGIVEVVQLCGFLPGLLLNGGDGVVSFARNSFLEHAVFAFKLCLELFDTIVRGDLCRFDELLGFLPRAFEHGLQFDFGFEEATQLGRRLGGFLRTAVFLLAGHVQLPAEKIPEGGRPVSPLKDIGSTS